MTSMGFTPPGSVYQLTESRRHTVSAELGTLAGRTDFTTRARTVPTVPGRKPRVRRQPVTTSRL